jgi:hypothetical protein
LTRQHIVIAIEQAADGPRNAHVLNGNKDRWSEEDDLACLWALSELLEMDAAARRRTPTETLVVYRLELVTTGEVPAARALGLSHGFYDWLQSIDLMSSPSLFH